MTDKPIDEKQLRKEVDKEIHKEESSGKLMTPAQMRTSMPSPSQAYTLTPVERAGHGIAGGLRAGSSKAFLSLKSHGTLLFLLIVAVFHFYLLAAPPQLPRLSLSSTYLLTLIATMLRPEFLFYILLALLATVAFYSDSDMTFLSRFWRFFLLSLASFYGTVIAANLKNSFAGWGIPFAVALIYLFSSAWIWYIALNPGEGRLVRLVAGAYMFIFTVALIVSILAGSTNLSAYTPTASLLMSPQEVSQSFKEFLAAGKDTVIDKPGALINKTCFKCFITGQINNVTQDYYTGQVEQSQGAPLGVTITDVKGDLQRYDVSLGDDITVSATLNARSLSENLDISHKCYLVYTGLDKNAKPIQGIVDPPTSSFAYSGDFQESQPLQCIIRNSQFKDLFNKQSVYSAQVFFNSSFQFETLGYIPFTFMSRDLLASLRRDHVDIRTNLGIETNPVPRYTPGPMMIGMAQASQPFTYEETNHKAVALPAFGITFSSAMIGKGTLQSLDEVHLYIPKQFEFRINDEGTDDSYRPGCTPGELQSGKANAITGGPTSSDGTWVDNANYWDYKIEKMPVRTNQNFITIRCPLVNNDLGAGSTLPVLGPSGVGLYTFYAYAKYSATAEGRTSVLIQGAVPGAP